MANVVRFETFPERDSETNEPTGKVRWRLRDANGRVTATSGDGFESRSHATDAITNVVGDICRMVVPGADSMTVRAARVLHVEE
jgi:hypothetical protein